MSLSVTPRLTLSRVRLHLPSQVPAGQQQQWCARLTTALNGVEIHPGLPPQAILVIRQLSDPQPGALLSGNRLRARRPWTEALESALEACWRKAARPAYEAVPSSAEAVRFADPAEWLACLSWDIHRGEVMVKWWWHTWLRSHPYRGPTDTLYGVWQTEAQWLPRAIEVLYRRGLNLQPLLARLEPSQADTVYRHLTQIYSLPTADPRIICAELWPVLPAPARSVAHQPLPVENQALAALCLAVTTAPTALQRYRQREKQGRGGKFLMPAEIQDSSDGPHTDKTSDVKPEPVSADPAGLPQNGQVQPKTMVKEPPKSLRKKQVSPSFNPDNLTNTSSSNNEGMSPPASSAPELSPKLRVETLASESLAVDPSIQTSVGGLWYLVNVLTGLDWLSPNDALNAWHKLQGVAQALLTGAAKGQRDQFSNDPVWDVLAELGHDDRSQAAIAQWLKPQLPIIENYLTDRLGPVDDFAGIIREPATLFITRTHIDVIFSLEQIRFDVRLAGLDRNPGWVPELARIITFHFH